MYSKKADLFSIDNQRFETWRGKLTGRKAAVRSGFRGVRDNSPYLRRPGVLLAKQSGWDGY